MSEDLHGRERGPIRHQLGQLAMVLGLLFGLLAGFCGLGIVCVFLGAAGTDTLLWLFRFFELATLSAIGVLIAKFCRVWASEDR